MKIQGLTIKVVAALGLVLLLAASAAAAQDDPGQREVRLAVEKGKKLLKDWKIEEARRQFEQARIASNDQAPAAFVGLAESELALDHLELALRHVDKALELVRNSVSKAEILNLKGMIMFRYATQLLPITPTTAAQPLDVENSAARFGQFMEARRARAAQAEPYFREALELSGGLLNAARLNLAESLERQGKREESRQFVEEYLSRAGKDDDPAAARNLMCWLSQDEPKLSAEAHKPGKITYPEKLESPQPEYPAHARKKRTQGAVITEMLVDEKGDVQCVRVLKGLPNGLSSVTVETLNKWKFKPATMDGKPVRVYYTTTTTFRLGG